MKCLWLTAIVLVFAAPAYAEPVTYACKIIDGANNIGMYDDVDQVIIDREAGLIDLRVARTIGTVAEVNWIFTTRTGYDGTPEKMWMEETRDGHMVAAGLDAAGSYSFKFDGRYLSFGVTYLAPAMAFTWECTE